MARGYSVTITDDDKFVVFKIKPTYKQTRDAKIAKKKPDDMPKDSLGIYDVEQNKLEKIARVKSYKMPEKAGVWLAYLMEKPLPETKDKKELDSIGKLNELSNKAAAMQKQMDSLNNLIAKAQEQGIHLLTPKKDSTAKQKKEDDIEEGTELVLRNLTDGKEQKIKLVQEYLFSKYGNKFVVETTKKNNSKLNSSLILFYLERENFTFPQDTLAKAYIDVKNFCFNEVGDLAAFILTNDTTKNEQKKYDLYFVQRIVQQQIHGEGRTILMQADNIENKYLNGVIGEKFVNENFSLFFSKSNSDLFFGLSPKLPPKDTTLPEFERVNVDVWNYKDDNLMTAQLKDLDKELKKSYLTKYIFEDLRIVKLGSPKFEPIRVTQEGDGKYFYAV
ncbi:MAG: hypothetical protein ACOVO1_09325, partial [Chitinophagaceae bacterium]